VSRSLRQETEAIALLLRTLMGQLFALEAGDPTRQLSVAQLRVRTVLLDGPHTMSETSRKLGISPSAMTQIADRLEVAGIARRASAVHDRRVRLLQLTPRGSRVMQLRNERRVTRVSEAIALLPAAARAEVLRALQTLEAAAGATVERGRRRGRRNGRDRGTAHRPAGSRERDGRAH
jgi:DNA-binding MarR family transcriptional regulator